MRIELDSFEPVKGGFVAGILVPEREQPNLNFGVISRRYEVFVPDRVLGILKDVAKKSETDEKEILPECGCQGCSTCGECSACDPAAGCPDCNGAKTWTSEV